jgi:hypothetical protein
VCVCVCVCKKRNGDYYEFVRVRYPATLYEKEVIHGYGLRYSGLLDVSTAKQLRTFRMVVVPSSS